MNIVLTGFMGTGKTTVGRRLAEDLKVPFVDVDRQIEKETGRSVRAIFESEGEAHFRELERKMILKLSEKDRHVIATGGGALLHPENRDALKRNGCLVCLTAKSGTLLERLKDDMSRPLLSSDDPAGDIERLMKARGSVYALADIQIQTDGKTIAEAAAAIREALRGKWS